MSERNVHGYIMTGPACDEDTLLTALRARDVEAFERVYLGFRGRVAGVVRRVVAGDALVEDVTQEVFAYLWEHPERVDTRRGSLTAFLCTLAHHRAVDAVRSEEARRRRIRTHTTAWHPLACDEDSVDVAEHVVRGEFDRMRRRALAQALGDLPPDQLTAVRLVYGRRLTVAGVAAELGVPVGTVKTRLRTAVARLRAAPQLSEWVDAMPVRECTDVAVA